MVVCLRCCGVADPCQSPTALLPLGQGGRATECPCVMAQYYRYCAVMGNPIGSFGPICKGRGGIGNEGCGTASVVGWPFLSKPDANLVIKALDMAYEQRSRPQNVLFQSDQGNQYGSRSFRQRLWRYRFTQSMSLRGNCYDNAPMERLFRSLKQNGYRAWVT